MQRSQPWNLIYTYNSSKMDSTGCYLKLSLYSLFWILLPFTAISFQFWLLVKFFLFKGPTNVILGKHLSSPSFEKYILINILLFPPSRYFQLCLLMDLLPVLHYQVEVFCSLSPDCSETCYVDQSEFKHRKTCCLFLQSAGTKRSMPPFLLSLTF